MYTRAGASVDWVSSDVYVHLSYVSVSRLLRPIDHNFGRSRSAMGVTKTVLKLLTYKIRMFIFLRNSTLVLDFVFRETAEDALSSRSLSKVRFSSLS